MSYILSCCTSVDLPAELLETRNIRWTGFHVTLGDREYRDDLGATVPHADFYRAMTEGADTKTAQINVDEYMNYKPPQPANFYVRGTFCDWNIRDNYAMEMVDGKAVFYFNFSHDIKFKVYSQSRDMWWGSEAISEDTTVPYTTAGRTNVCLQKGKYKVVFDPETLLITITYA